MKSSSRQLFLGAAVAWFFTLTLATFAQDNPPPPPAPPAADKSAPAEVAAPVAPATPVAIPAAEVPPAPAVATEAAPATPAPAATTEAAPAPEPAQRELRRIDEPTPAAPPAKARNTRGSRTVRSGQGNARVGIASDSHLGPGETAEAVVAIGGSATSEGGVSEAVVSVMGNSTVRGGSVGDAVVSVLGNTYVDAKIGGEAVAVLGNVELGPNAEIGGDVVSVGGVVKRDPGAIVHGSVQNVSIMKGLPVLTGLQVWFRECALLGRPLALAPGLGWVWTITLAFFALYVLLALVFGPSVEKCAQTFETRPGGTILASILTILLTPVLIILLLVTVVGIAAVPFVALGLFCAGLFGKAVMLVWIGRRFTKFFGDGPLSLPVVAAFIGGVIVLALYLVPFVGMTVQKTLDVLGLGVVVYTLILSSKRDKPAAPAPMMPAPAATGSSAAAAGWVSGAVAAPMGAGDAGPMTGAGDATVPPTEPAGFAAAAPTMGAPLPPPPVVPLAISVATMPRAGFWIRVAALALDGILVGVVLGITGLAGKFLLLALAAYGAIMWKFKGTTIGGVVCGLKVVRLDQRDIDWSTAIVRALGCFLSLIVAGLGFIWVAVDDEKQSWHDKIAGTTVVRVPKGTSLL